MKGHSLDGSLEGLLEDGMTEKMARALLDAARAEARCGLYDPAYVSWAHERGFFVEHACSYGLDDKTVGDYVSDYEFAKAWPLNSWARIWINDKLTLRLMLSEPEFRDVLPEYFCYSTAGGLLPVADGASVRDGSVASLLSVLEREGDLAAKPNNSSCAEGFCHLSFREGAFFVNHERTDADGVARFVATHPNYVFTEFIRPAAAYARISPLVHTLRVCVLNETGRDPKIFNSYFRFPNRKSDISNYAAFDGSTDGAYHIYVEVDMETGEWGNGKIVHPTRIGPLAEHPESGQPLHGRIDDIGRLRELVFGIARKFNLVEFMGFDFGITDKGFRLMEINSHPAIATPQLFKPFRTDPALRDYFARKLAAVEALSPDQRRVRNGIRR